MPHAARAHAARRAVHRRHHGAQHPPGGPRAPEPLLVAATIAIGFATYAAVQVRIPRLARPELWLFGSFLFAKAAIAAGVVLADRVADGGLILMLWPMVGLTARLPWRAVLATGGWCGVLVVAAWAVSDPSGMLADPAPVLVSLGVGLTIVLLVSTLRDSDTANHAAAICDRLTGTLNRAALDQRVRELEFAAGPLREALAIVVLDINRFKQINDAHGHAVGDDVLRSVARTLETQLRIGDELYRLGGEEFSWRRVFRRADGALYDAKERGRDRVCVAARHLDAAPAVV